jgi:SAM-dependent methyltransferase|tara:strand:+ start:7520 stop:8425 length:906 start_codon:yes stop_codon:yes gene_type:complete
MGFDDKATQFLLAARRLGVSFEQTATIGRQRLYVTTAGLRQRLNEFGIPTSKNDAQGVLDKNDGYSEPLLHLLGATRTVSIDASDYEGASSIVDLNQTVPAELTASFTAVIDSGTLEHIFDFPTAIRNCMQMVKPGGHLLSVTVANNLSGHGFYQFSPELFYRVLSNANGFEVKRILVTETSSPHWYEVADPVEIHGRVQLRTFRPTYLCVIAQRTAITPMFETVPQQSDYVTRWDAAEKKTTSRITTIEGLHPIEQRAPARVALAVKSLYHFLQATVLPFDRRAFRRVEITKLGKTDSSQ